MKQIDESGGKQIWKIWIIKVYWVLLLLSTNCFKGLLVDQIISMFLTMEKQLKKIEFSWNSLKYQTMDSV